MWAHFWRACYFPLRADMIVVHTVWDEEEEEEEEEEEGDLGDDGALHWGFALLVRWRWTGCVESSSVETRPNARRMTVKMNFFFFFFASWLPCLCVLRPVIGAQRR